MTAPDTNMPYALIVDDEPDILELLRLTLNRMRVQCKEASDIATAKRLLNDGHFDFCLTDMRLPDGDGLDLVRYIQARHPATPVAVITAHGNIETAVEALKAGAFDFVIKPIELRVLRDLVAAATKAGRTGTTKPSKQRQHQLLGTSPAISELRSIMAKLAHSQAPVYISGESGTGKELVARLIHQQGPRADRPFVPVNCGAIPTELMESELFGHKRGSFTGATADKDGLFQAANSGTLFLDEVADLPLAMQVKLLRAIQEKAIRPVGAQKEVHVDVRILSATHRNLAELVQQGRFREDLYYRINVIELHVPALRDRAEDIPQLVEHVLQRLAAQMGLTAPHLTPKAVEALTLYPFPGNVRELENILERALTLCESDTITPDDLQLPSGSANITAPSQEGGLEPLLEDMERQTIVEALERARYNKTKAAQLLGISFRALRYRLKKLGID